MFTSDTDIDKLTGWQGLRVLDGAARLLAESKLPKMALPIKCDAPFSAESLLAKESLSATLKERLRSGYLNSSGHAAFKTLLLIGRNTDDLHDVLRRCPRCL